jgi:zinc/manganese transport system ATP-binding protein
MKQKLSPSFPIVSFTHMSVKYRDQLALQDINGHINSGSLTAILGPNGGGKSTLLKTLSGFLKPFRGSVKYQGINARQIAYLPQQADIDRSFPLTVREVVAMGLTQERGFLGDLEGIYEKNIREALAQVGLTQHFNRSLHTLSGGQFQRALFARLSIQKSDLILLDEPFSAIDHSTIEDLMKLVLNWHQEGKTILIVTHDLELIKKYFSETLLLAKKIIAWGSTPEVLTLDNLRKAKKLSCDWENRLELEPDEFLTTL